MTQDSHREPSSQPYLGALRPEAHSRALRKTTGRTWMISRDPLASPPPGPRHCLQTSVLQAEFTATSDPGIAGTKRQWGLGTRH